MIDLRRLTEIALITGFALSSMPIKAQQLNAVLQIKQDSLAVNRPVQWTLQDCINYALRQNITLLKSKVNAASTAVDVKTAKAALFPSLSFSASENVANRPFQESSTYLNGSEVMSSSSKTTLSGNYGLNAGWTVYNGGKREKTIKQSQLYNKMAELNVATSGNEIEESIIQTYVQILYAAESIKVNENTLAVSEAQFKRGQQLLNAGSLSKASLAQLESQVSSDKYQLVTAQATLQDYKLQLKQLLELDGDEELNLYIPTLDDTNVLTPLPEKMDVYKTALTLRPEIESGKLNIQSSDLGIDIAKAGYMPTVGLNAGVSTNHTSGSDYNFGQQLKNGWNNSIGLSVSVPIFNNRETKSAVEKAKLQRETNKLALLDTQKTLYKTIENLWLNAHSAQQSYVAAKEKLKSTQTSFELISEQFDMGMKNTVELLTEKNNMLNAQQQTLQAKYMAILNAGMLRFYQGENFSNFSGIK